MKTAELYHQKVKTRHNIPYPNAATKKEIAHKILDILLSAACGAAFATIVLFLMTIA